MKVVKERVEKLLEEIPGLRNNDELLVWTYWEVYETSGNLQSINREQYINFLMNADTIKRCRRIIQNDENRYLPNSEEVRKHRKIKQYKWELYLKSLHKEKELF